MVDLGSSTELLFGQRFVVSQVFSPLRASAGIGSSQRLDRFLSFFGSIQSPLDIIGEIKRKIDGLIFWMNAVPMHRT